MNLTGRFGSQDQEQGGTLLNSKSNRVDRTLGVDGRYLVAGWNLESRFSVANTRSEYPARALTKGRPGGYGESLKVAMIDATVSRSLTRKITLRANGSVSLSSYRYYVIVDYPNPPVDRDQYRQSYRIEGQYSGSARFNSGLVLDVTRNVLVNLRAGSTASNNEATSYRAEWRWSYRMLPGLTATQNNSIGADYIALQLPSHERPALAGLQLFHQPERRVLAAFHGGHPPQRPAPAQRHLHPVPDGYFYLSRSEENDTYTLWRA